MKKFLTILGGIVVGAAAVAGAVYAVLYFLKKDKDADDSCCYIDDDCEINCDDCECKDECEDACVSEDAEEAVEEAVEEIAEEIPAEGENA